MSFSIVVPSYQRRAMVCETVRTLSSIRCEQSAELIVVVDGSTDGTAAALAQIPCPFPIRVVEQENRGLAAARNHGAALAGNEILLFLDDDLLCEPDLLQQHARMHREGADAVTGEIPLHPRSRSGLVTDALAKAAEWRREPPLSAFDVYGGHLSIRRCVFETIGGFDEALHAGGYGGEDLDLGLRLVGRYDVRHNPSAVAWQLNLVIPREHMRRARQLAQSDLRLIAKHPGVGAQLLAGRGLDAAAKPPAMLRVSRLPCLPALAAAVASAAAELAQHTRFASSDLLSRLYFAARSASYWSEFRVAGGEKVLRWLSAL